MPETATDPIYGRAAEAVAKLNKVEAYSAYPSKLTIDLPPEATGIFQRMLDETGMSPAELVWSALSLLSIAREAQRSGLAVGGADSADGLKVEFRGF